MAAFEAWLVFLILVVNVVGELQRKRTLAASRGFLAAARLSCQFITAHFVRHCTLKNALAITACPNKLVLDLIGLGFKHLTRKPS